MKLIADENIPLKVVERLRKENIDLESIIENAARYGR